MVRYKLAGRLREVGLEIHPEKTHIVYCRDDCRRKCSDWPKTSFESLGYVFTESFARNQKTGRLFRRFPPAIGSIRLKELGEKLKK